MPRIGPPEMARRLLARALAAVLEVWDSSRPTLPPAPGPKPVKKVGVASRTGGRSGLLAGLAKPVQALGEAALVEKPTF